MERYEVQPMIRWNKNRATTMLLLGISILLLVYMFNQVVRIVYLDQLAQKQQKEIEKIKESFDQIIGTLPSKDENGLYIEIFAGEQIDGSTLITVPNIK